MDTYDKIEERLRIGNQINRLRTESGLSVRELAEQCDFSPANIVRIEKGKYSVGIDLISKVANALGATIKIEKL